MEHVRSEASKVIEMVGKMSEASEVGTERWLIGTEGGRKSGGVCVIDYIRLTSMLNHFY